MRATARFTLHLVHTLQALAAQVRTFAFVDESVEITDLFAEHRLEDALSLVMAGLPAGGVLDVDADSDYGGDVQPFLEQYGSAHQPPHDGHRPRRRSRQQQGPRARAPSRRSTRRARETVWLTPEPRYSWGLGRCDLPLYAEHCDRVEVVRGLRGLDLASTPGATAR